VLLLSISSIKGNKKYDPTCSFVGGEHEFISKPSYVVYGMPEQKPVLSIQKCVANNYFIPKDDLDTKIFERICAGISLSDFSRPWMIDYFIDNTI
jgi:hypothetical protein